MKISNYLRRFWRDVGMSEEDNVIDFVSKSQMRRIAKEMGRDVDEITDEDFRVAIRALFGPDEIRGHEPK
jgi:hypothetical protein